MASPPDILYCLRFSVWCAVAGISDPPGCALPRTGFACAYDVVGIFIGDNLLGRWFPWITAVFLIGDVTTEQDFFACLFAILGMQAMECYFPREVGGLTGLFALLTYRALLERIGLLQALALALV